MSTETVSNAVAKRDNGMTALIAKYSADFASVLPSHVRSETWVRLAQGALRKGKRDPDGRFQLEIAAANNPGVFLAALLDAARLGLEPGTEQYYLTPRKVKGRLEILGIIGYQGHIELMYRAGAVTSVVAEVVRTKDLFAWTPGALDREEPKRWQGPQVVPFHEIDWDADDRGTLRLVYAYARMGEATSRVVVLNRSDIARAKASSQGADSEYSPWRLYEAAMWLKTAVRQLQKWVPTSAEYRREIMRARAEVERVTTERELPLAPTEFPDTVDGEVIDGDWPVVAQTGGE